MLTVDDHN